MSALTAASPALLERAMLWCYALFLAGFFVIPEAPDHYKLYYLLVFLPSLFLWRRCVSLLGHNALFLLIIASSGYMMASVVWSAEASFQAAVQVVWYAALVISFVAVGALLASEYPTRFDLMLRGLVWFAACAGAVSMVVFYAGHSFPYTRLQPPLSRMDNAVLASCVYGVFCLLALHYFVGAAGKKDRLAYVLCVLALLTAILLTQSRTVLPALSLGFVILLGLRGIIIVGVLAAGIVVAFLLDPELWQQQLTRGLSFRPDIWQAVLQQASEHWYFGRGYLGDTNVQVNAAGLVHVHAHSAYLATLRDGGVVGLTLLLSMLSVAVYRAVKLASCGQRLYLALLLYALVCLIADMDRLLTRPKEHWLYFWLPVILVMAAQLKNQTSARHTADK